MIELAHIRNMIANDRVDQDLMREIHEVLSIVEKNEFPMARIIEFNINRCINFLNNKDYVKAINELQLAHNIPHNKNSYQNWNEKFFYNVTFVNYLEDVEDYKCIKEVILLFAKADNELCPLL